MRARWFTGSKVDPVYVAKNFVPVALDSYYRGSKSEVLFANKIRAKGNHLVAVTASGRILAPKVALRLRRKELSVALGEFARMPRIDRQPTIPKSEKTERPGLPQPPKNALIVRGHCSYLRVGTRGKLRRAQRYYYEENPDRWAVETQTDMLWLKEAEWKSMVPTNARKGQTLSVSKEIQRRFYGTIGIEYMEGSVNALPVRDSTMTLTVTATDKYSVDMRLDGYGKMGKAYKDGQDGKAKTRGCELRVLGYLRYDHGLRKFVRFELVGLGQAWGNKMEYTQREIRIRTTKWLYGINCQLVKGTSDVDYIPPYNMLHYKAFPYFKD